MASGRYYLQPSGSQLVGSEFRRLGHPGKFSAAKTVQNTTMSFTGSNYGYGALIVGESSAAGTVSLSGGGDVNIAHLTVGRLYEFSISKVVESGNKKVYVFKRQLGY
tara:strand:+ start:57 stop:377 length:321 start_codon:yes stop_codon:yes gene_type:complete